MRGVKVDAFVAEVEASDTSRILITEGQPERSRAVLLEGTIEHRATAELAMSRLRRSR